MTAASNVTQQYLNDPVDWGTIASSNVALMTPPAHVLEAALSDVNPTEVAYVIVMERRPRKVPVRSPSPPPKPTYRLVIDDEEEPVEPSRIEEVTCLQELPAFVVSESIQETSTAPKPAFKLLLDEEDIEDSISKDSTGSDMSSLPAGDEAATSWIESVKSFESLKSDILETVLEEETIGESQSVPSPALTSHILHQLTATESKSRKLELQLRQCGVSVVTEEISYDIAKQKIAEIASRMNQVSDSSPEYFTLEQEMEKYNSAMLLTDEYQKEQQAAEQQWEESNADANQAALEQLRRHLPINIRRMSVDELSQSTNVPYDLLKRFKRTDVLSLLRVNPIAIERMHPSTLENMRVTGLTLSERRALYAHLRTAGDKWKAKSDAMMTRKYTWFTMLRNNFREAMNAYDAHVRHYPLVNEACSCPMHRSCPVMTDANLGYMVDGAGQPAAAEYEPMDVMMNKSFRETTSSIVPQSNRREELRKFYKGSLQDTSEAAVACETMDDLLVNIQYGMQQPDETFAKTKVLLADVKLSLQGLAKRKQVSPLEMSLLQQVCRASSGFCDVVETRIKEAETIQIGLDAKGTSIATSAIRILVDEISESFTQQ